MSAINISAHQLISNNKRKNKIVLPDIKRIHDVNQFMSAKFNGNIDNFLESFKMEAAQCEKIVDQLRAEGQLKKNALHQVKLDLLKLQSELVKPKAQKRFVVEREKIVVKMDGSEAEECVVPQALELYSVQISCLYGEILALDSDADYVVYLHSIALMNLQQIRDHYECTKKQEKLQKKLEKELAKIEQAGAAGDAVEKMKFEEELNNGDELNIQDDVAAELEAEEDTKYEVKDAEDDETLKPLCEQLEGLEM